LFQEIQNGEIGTISPDHYLTKCSLDKVFVGQSIRDVVNIVETSHSVFGVCSMFGSFIKFIVACGLTNSMVVSVIDADPGSKRRRDDHCIKMLPTPVTEKNRKDKHSCPKINLDGWMNQINMENPLSLIYAKFYGLLMGIIWFFQADLVQFHHYFPALMDTTDLN
jgi:hypothetical protein